MQWPSSIDRPMIRLRFSKSIMTRTAEARFATGLPRAGSSGDRRDASLWMRAKTARSARRSARHRHRCGGRSRTARTRGDRSDRDRRFDLRLAVEPYGRGSTRGSRFRSARSRRPGAPLEVVGREGEHPVEGMAVAGSSSGSRKSLSVASRAASVSLPQRKARASGSFFFRITAAALPTMMPHCGPPMSLSPLKQTTSAPAADARLDEGLGRPGRSGRDRRGRRCRGRR